MKNLEYIKLEMEDKDYFHIRKDIFFRHVDAVNKYHQDDAEFIENYMNDVGKVIDSTCKLRNFNDYQKQEEILSNVAATLIELLEAVPGQTDYNDWWPDELTHAVQKANLALDQYFEYSDNEVKKQTVTINGTLKKVKD